MEHWSGLVAKSLIASALLWASSAAAVDGVIEINQAKADAGAVNGSLASDPAGFPVVITQPGAYRLTGDLTVPDTSTTAIQVTAANVDIDLNGFAILGPYTYIGAPFICSYGSGPGVHSTSASATNVRVHDGTIRGVGGSGVALQGRSEISHVLAQENGGYGFIAGDRSIVSENRVINNCGVGINAGDSSSVWENVVSGNSEDGILIGQTSSASGNTVTGNGTPAGFYCGIRSFGQSGGWDNTVTDNPAGCAGSGSDNCCPLSNVRVQSCNLVDQANGELRTCCPNPSSATTTCY
jgi:hypothetical protein